MTQGMEAIPGQLCLIRKRMLLTATVLLNPEAVCISQGSPEIQCNRMCICMQLGHPLVFMGNLFQIPYGY